MAKYSNYTALNDLVKVFNSDLMASFGSLHFVVLVNSSRPDLSQVYVWICGAHCENHRSRLLANATEHSETSLGFTFQTTAFIV